MSDGKISRRSFLRQLLMGVLYTHLFRAVIADLGEDFDQPAVSPSLAVVASAVGAGTGVERDLSGHAERTVDVPLCHHR